jgi:hypothetical protein
MKSLACSAGEPDDAGRGVVLFRLPIIGPRSRTISRLFATAAAAALRQTVASELILLWPSIVRTTCPARTRRELIRATIADQSGFATGAASHFPAPHREHTYTIRAPFHGFAMRVIALVD